MTAVHIHGVPSMDARTVWPVVEAWVSAACEYADGLIEARHILDEIERAERQLWVVCLDGTPAAVATTRIDVHPTGIRVLSVPTVGGSGMDLWLGPLVDTLRRYARAQGCVGLEGCGRRGWTRALKKHGWQERCVTVTTGVGNE